MKRLRGDSTNPFTILLFVALAVAAYAAFFYVPLYMDNLDVKEAVAQAYNVVLLEGEAGAKSKFVFRTSTIGEHFQVNDDGVEEVKPGLGLLEDSLVVTEAGTKLTVSIEYDRVIVLKPTEKRRTVHFSVMKTGTVKR
jgi:hypothetical protein